MPGIGGIAGRCCATACAALAVLGAAHAASSTVVISEIQTGEKGSTTSKFIELHNLTDQRIDISGYTVVYRSATSTVNTVNYTAPAGASIAPQGYLLLVSPGYQTMHPFQASNGSITDRTLGNAGGGIAVFPGPPPADGVTGRIDALGYGSASNGFVEGSAAAAPGSAAAQSLERKPAGQGSQDTDNNAADFTVTTRPTPTATETGAQPPVVSGVIIYPASVLPGSPATVTAEVTPRAQPIASVTVDLSGLGLSDQTPMVKGEGSVYSAPFTVPAGAPAGRYTLTVTGRDEANASGSGIQFLGVKTTDPPVSALTAHGAPYNSALRVHGIVTAVSTGYANIEDADGSGGILISDGTPITGVYPLELGQDVTINGVRQNVTNESALLITGPDDIEVNASSAPLPAPHIVTASAVAPESADPELYQGQLVTLRGLTVTQAPDALAFLGTANFVATDATGSISVFLNLNATRYATSPYPGSPANPIPAEANVAGAIAFPEIKVGNVYDITGPLGRRSGNVGSGPFEVIRPRDANDLVLVSPAPTDRGDANRSGSVTIDDVLLVLRLSAGLEAGPMPSVSLENADVSPVNGPDGKVGLDDAVTILRFLNGLETLH